MIQSPELQLRYVIIDDDEIDRAVVVTEAAKFSFLQKIAVCSNPVEALEIITRIDPEIIFLDIEMPGFSGIELIRKKITAYGQPVFITSHPEFALEGFELEAFDYLLKPVSSERFARCAFRLRDFYQMRIKACAFDTGDDSNFIIIKQGYDKYKIPVHDILYVEAMRDYTRVVTAKKQYLVLSTLNGFAKKLPGTFVRIHRSYIVNRNKVDAVQKNKINIQSQELPVGKLYKHALSFPD
ncbi:MAG: LytTR family DNA-binding domain-containing protein [Ginsengibacter sp.]